MLNKLKTIFQLRHQFLHLMVGVPSYEKYVEHLKSHHPEKPIPTRKEFFCEAQEAKYNGKDGQVSRCC